MKKIMLLLCLLLVGVASATFAQDGEADFEGSKDYKLMSRLPGYYIADYKVNDFDSYTSPYIPADNVWEGELTKISYTGKEKREKKLSFVQIVRNYENAVKKLGGAILYTEENKLVAKIDKDGQVTYVELVAYNDGNNYELLFVEKKEMQDEVVVPASKPEVK